MRRERQKEGDRNHVRYPFPVFFVCVLLLFPRQRVPRRGYDDLPSRRRRFFFLGGVRKQFCLLQRSSPPVLSCMVKRQFFAGLLQNGNVCAVSDIERAKGNSTPTTWTHPHTHAYKNVDGRDFRPPPPSSVGRSHVEGRTSVGGGGREVHHFAQRAFPVPTECTLAPSPCLTRTGRDSTHR